MSHERDYLERTIATVRNHRGADNCWPQWANIFADEIERLWQVESAAAEVAGNGYGSIDHRAFYALRESLGWSRG